MSRLVNELLDLARIEAGHVQLNVEPIKIFPFIERVTQKFQNVSEERNITIEVTGKVEAEFDNSLIDQALETFGIERSLSEKGSPYDNAVAEATFKSIKTEFVYGRVFSCQQELDLELFDYVNWFNNIRIHGSLNYQSPVEYKRTNL